MDELLAPLRRWNDFDGRASRREFWPFFLFACLVGAAAKMVLGWFLGFLVVLFLFLPSLAVMVRRFHDQDRSGWMALFWIVPVVGWIIVLVFMAMEGTPGPNRFGEEEL